MAPSPTPDPSDHRRVATCRTVENARVNLEGADHRRCMTKVTVVGNNQIYDWENRVGPIPMSFGGAQPFGVPPPPPPPLCDIPSGCCPPPPSPPSPFSYFPRGVGGHFAPGWPHVNTNSTSAGLDRSGQRLFPLACGPLPRWACLDHAKPVKTPPPPFRRRAYECARPVAAGSACCQRPCGLW